MFVNVPSYEEYWRLSIMFNVFCWPTRDRYLEVLCYVKCLLEGWYQECLWWIWRGWIVGERLASWTDVAQRHLLWWGLRDSDAKLVISSLYYPYVYMFILLISPYINSMLLFQLILHKFMSSWLASTIYIPLLQ